MTMGVPKGMRQEKLVHLFFWAAPTFLPSRSSTLALTCTLLTKSGEIKRLIAV